MRNGTVVILQVVSIHASSEPILTDYSRPLSLALAHERILIRTRAPKATMLHDRVCIYEIWLDFMLFRKENFTFLRVRGVPLLKGK